MNIAISGSRSITPAQHAFLRLVLSRDVPAGSTLVTGACTGVDAAAARIGRELGFSVITIVPADRHAVDPNWRDFCDQHVEMAKGTSYRDRNEKMVSLAEKLIAFPARETVHRSGTWMTINIARRKGIQVAIHVQE